MPASEAQIRANQANCLKSTGPRTQAGKEKSRANAIKHGLTGAGLALPNEDAAEVERRIVAFREELKPVGEVQEVLVRQVVVTSVRLDRCVSEETARLTARINQALADLVVPAEASAEEGQQMIAHAGAQAMADATPEGILARKYESAAWYGFLRAFKELKTLQAPSKPDREASKLAREQAKIQKEMASFLNREAQARPAAPKPVAAQVKPAIVDDLTAILAERSPKSTPKSPYHGAYELPIAIGKPR